MFNNRFNSSKNDPLVEAVKAARADGDTRRLAESMTNGLFGVFSRQAVVREHLSDYDYALEEAYKCMKEEDKMADKDYDRDGKVETSKKEVWGSRLRAAKASGKYKGPVDEDSSNGLPPSDAAKQAGAAQQAQTPSSTPKRTGNAAGSTISNARDAAGMQEAQIDEVSKDLALKAYAEREKRQSAINYEKGSGSPEATDNSSKAGKTYRYIRKKFGTKALGEEQIDELKAPTGKTARQVMDRAERRDDEEGNWTRSNRLYKSMKKRYPGKSARNQKDTGKTDLPNTGNVEFHKAGYPGHVTKGGKLTKSASKETKSDIRSRLGKHTKPKNLPEESLDEISKELAGRYVKQADYKRSESSFRSGKVYGKELATKRRTKQDVEDSRKHNRDSFKREKGINMAVNKLTGKAKVQANEEIMKESIVAKLFAKHMEEQIGQVSAAPKLSSFGSAFAAARKSGQSNFSFGGKSFNTKLASSSSTPKATPTMGRTPEAAASRTSGSSLPSMASATPAAKPAPAPVGKRDFASTLGRDVGSGPTIKPDAPKPPVDKFSFGQNIMNPPKADSTPAPSSSSPTPSTPPVERGGSSNPPGAATGNPTPVGGGAITQDAQKAQATTQDAGTKVSRWAQRMAESVEVGSNKYRIV